MRMVLVGCALVLAASVEPASAQEAGRSSAFALCASRPPPPSAPSRAPQGRAGQARNHGGPGSRKSSPASPQAQPTDPQATASRAATAAAAAAAPDKAPAALAMAHHAHDLDRARREGLRGVRAEDRRERLPQHACLPRRRPVQSAVSRLQPARHALLCRLRRPALHAARLLCLEERPALLLFDRGDAARVFARHPLHRARQRHHQPPRSHRCRPRCAQGHPADRRHHLLGALPLSAQLHGQAAARPLPRQASRATASSPAPSSTTPTATSPWSTR